MEAFRRAHRRGAIRGWLEHFSNPVRSENALTGFLFRKQVAVFRVFIQKSRVMAVGFLLADVI
jgi:hypothetical protein